MLLISYIKIVALKTVYEIFARIVMCSYKSHALAALPVIMFLLLNFSNVSSRHQNANQAQTWYVKNPYSIMAVL